MSVYIRGITGTVHAIDQRSLVLGEVPIVGPWRVLTEAEAQVACPSLFGLPDPNAETARRLIDAVFAD